VFQWQRLLVQLVVANYVDRFALGKQLRLLTLGRLAQDPVGELDHRAAHERGARQRRGEERAFLQRGQEVRHQRLAELRAALVRLPSMLASVLLAILSVAVGLVLLIGATVLFSEITLMIVASVYLVSGITMYVVRSVRHRLASQHT